MHAKAQIVGGGLKSNMETRTAKYNYSKIDILISFLGLSGLTILLSAFFLTLFGVIDLRYVNNLKLPFILEYIGHLCLFLISFWFLMNIPLRIEIIRSLLYTISYIPIYAISIYFYDESMISSTIIPNIFIILVAWKEKKLNKTHLIYILLINVFVAIFQIIAIFVKGLFIGFDYTPVNLISLFVFSIDYILLNLFIYKEVIRYDRKRMVFTKSNSVQQNAETCKETLNTDELNRRQRVIFALMVWGYQIFQLLVVLAIGAVNNMFIELIAMLVMFWIGRKILVQSWHSDKLWICSVATFSGFYILTKITPPFEISLFMVVASTGAFIYLMHILGVKADRLEELEDVIDPELTFKNKLRKLGFKEKEITFACEIKFQQLSAQEQADIYGITEKSIRNKRNLLYKELAKFDIFIQSKRANRTF